MTVCSNPSRCNTQVAYLAAATKNHAHPLVILDLDGNILNINPAARQLLAQLQIDFMPDLLPGNYRQNLHSCWQLQKIPPARVKVGDRVLYWTYHSLTPLSLVYLHAFDITTSVQVETKLRQTLS